MQNIKQRFRPSHDDLVRWLETHTIGGGAIVPAYLTPVSGAVPPTPAQGAPVNEVYAELTGDGAATSLLFVHNLGVSAADLAAGYPEVFLEPLLAAFYTEHPVVTLKTANNVTITVLGTAATQFVGVRVKRPNTITR
jgi:hypothetical protein